MLWPRHYYIVPLEVSSFNSKLSIKAKRFYREKNSDKEEITNLDHPVFAGQIFAEMLGAICHEELYRYVDQEVLLLPGFIY